MTNPRFLAILLLLILASACITDNPQTNQTSQNQNPIQQVQQKLQQKIQGCSGGGTVMFNTSPMNLEDVGVIIPMGLVVGGHVTPIDHAYFSPINFSSLPDTYDVYSIGRGVITQIGLEGPPIEAHIKPTNKYRLTIYYTCDFYAIYNLVTSLSPRILSITGEIAPRSNTGVNIPVEPGELLGKIGGQTLDLSLNDNNIILPGFLVPEHYKREEWKIHTVDPFDYFTEPLRTQLLAKNVRSAEPRGGKIDYDIDGRLVGNWFVEGTNGYAGSNPYAYWETHLSIAPNHIDPSFIVVSLGNYSGSTAQFGTKANSPDPATVSKESGIIKYELMNFNFIDGSGQIWNGMSVASNVSAVTAGPVQGTVLFQLISDRRLKVEAFPGKTADEVSSFVNPTTYER